MKHKRPKWTTHEKLFEALIFSANEKEAPPMSEAYLFLKEVWYFINSDVATYNGEVVEKNKRPLLVNPIIKGKPRFGEFFKAEKEYCATQDNINLIEQDFITDISNWLEKKSKDKSVSIPRKRKLDEFLEYIETKALPPQQTTNENETIRYTAKHYVLAYLIECNAKGESFPIGQKKELEKIGNRIMGAGKGNRFYKVFNETVNKDLNVENNLIEIGGENWRTIVKDLSNEPETIETYLQSKQL